LGSLGRRFGSRVFRLTDAIPNPRIGAKRARESGYSVGCEARQLANRRKRRRYAGPRNSVRALRIKSRDWASYPILTFSDVPKLDIILINHPDLPPLGVAEAALPPVPAAIANAFYNATGKRLRGLPFDRNHVKAALL
jgi:hypothetical protein